MALNDLVLQNRSYRRFDGGSPVSAEALRSLIELARITPSASNLQPLKYLLSCSHTVNDAIFPTLSWAGYLKDWPGPGEGERPTAYIVVLLDTALRQNADMDVGIVAQTILLGAAELGLGGCMIGSIKREELRKRLSIPEQLEISLVIALGKPVERVVLEYCPRGGSIRYYRDGDRTHHVPKRSVDELIFKTCS